MRTVTRTLVVTTAAAAFGIAAVSPALAEDCFNASRSGQGNTSAAAHSGNWWSIPEFLHELAGLDASQIDAAMAVISKDPRVPAGFTVFFNPAHPGELASNANPKVVTDGKGIDHSDDYSTPVFAALFEDVSIALS
jgi:hypothetical protein